MVDGLNGWRLRLRTSPRSTASSHASAASHGGRRRCAHRAFAQPARGVMAPGLRLGETGEGLTDLPAAVTVVRRPPPHATDNRSRSPGGCSRGCGAAPEGEPAEPPTLSTAVPNWRPGDPIPLGRSTLRVVALRDDDADAPLVLVVEPNSAERSGPRLKSDRRLSSSLTRSSGRSLSTRRREMSTPPS
jgi:hypothetical protein